MERPCILIVDDHRSLLAGICDVLEMEGYTVFAAADGVQALQMMEKEVCPDLIVSDIAMPGMDGYALLEAVHARPEWMLIPFIFLTAETGRENMLKAKELGAKDYITKPFSPRELIKVVRIWLERTRAAWNVVGYQTPQSV